MNYKNMMWSSSRGHSLGSHQLQPQAQHPEPSNKLHEDGSSLGCRSGRCPLCVHDHVTAGTSLGSCRAAERLTLTGEFHRWV